MSSPHSLRWSTIGFLGTTFLVGYIAACVTPGTTAQTNTSRGESGAELGSVTAAALTKDTAPPDTSSLGSYFPGTEKLGPDEMRVVSCGTGMPAQRRSQAATCWLLELGNGDKFIFDIGDLGVHWAGGWTGGRHGALHIWGPSGQKPETGTKYCIEKLKESYTWDYTSRLGVIPTGGGALEVHEFDYRQDNKVVYEKNGVTIRSWPAIHSIDGCVSYSVEWKGLKFVFGGDTLPNKWMTVYAKNADFAIHECFMTPPLMMEKYGFSPQTALLVATKVHTAPAAFGKIMAMIKPRMAVAYHFFNDFDTRLPIYEGIRRTYDGPLTLATDLLCWNITKKEIRLRQVIVDDQAWPARPPTPPDKPDRSRKTPFSKAMHAGILDVNDVLGPLIADFKKKHGLK